MTIRVPLALAAALLAGPALAAPGTDPDWPCIQRLQPHLTMGQVWAGPPPDEATPDLVRDPRIARLADRLEQRRLPLEEAAADIEAFAADSPPEQMPERMVALMQAIFDRIDRDRAALIAGISRYGRAQVDLAARIEERRARMAELEQSEDPDFDAIDAEEQALDWDQRVFQERQQSLTYVCETPVILEQRVFALGRAITERIR